jgi:hypothetical protein
MPYEGKSHTKALGNTNPFFSCYQNVCVATTFSENFQPLVIDTEFEI